MFQVLSWWLVVEVLGLISWPIAFVAFQRLPDRGYFLSKPLGILVASYVLWLAATFHILPNSRGSILLILFILSAISFVIYSRQKTEIANFWAKRRKTVLFTEILFVMGFLVAALVRSYNPDIVGTEKPMEFAFLNSILRSDYFPPGDPWLSGFSISYYYFGYVMMAMLTKLSGVASSIAFNLGISLLFALTLTGAFGVVFALVWHSEEGRESKNTNAPYIAGILAAVFVGIAGNLEGVLEILRSHGFGTVDFWQWISIKDLAQPYQSASWYPADTWWWWRASRVIDTIVNGKSLDYTITEFPFFSFLLADMHPHVLALPFVFLALGLAVNALFSPIRISLEWVKQKPHELLLISLILGALGFLNSWDFPTYTLVFLGVLAVKWYIGHSGFNWRDLRNLAVPAGAILALSVLLYLPFYIGFRSQASGILPVGDVSTNPLHFIVIWGFFLSIVVAFLIQRVLGGKPLESKMMRIGLGSLFFVMLPFLVWAAVEIGIGVAGGSASSTIPSIWDKLFHSLPYIFLAWLALFALVSQVLRPKLEYGSSSSLFVSLIICVGFLLILGCEFFFIKDVFGSRMNTVFKFYYQAWVLVALACSYGLYYAGSRWKPSTSRWRVGMPVFLTTAIILFAGVMVYPAAATASKTNAFSGNASLDGLDYTRKLAPDEYDAIEWLKDNVSGRDVVVESVGSEYSDFARVSTRTGLPTILGWAGHELQWRGTDSDFKGREAEVDEIYQSPDRNRVLELLRKYQVRYIYVGNLEKSKYGNSVGNNFNGFLEVAYRNNGVTIFRVP